MFVDLRLAEVIQGRLKLKFVDTSRSVHPKYPEIFHKAVTFQIRQAIQVSHPLYRPENSHYYIVRNS
jgi:hypothetical protein